MITQFPHLIQRQRAQAEKLMGEGHTKPCAIGMAYMDKTCNCGRVR